MLEVLKMSLQYLKKKLSYEVNVFHATKKMNFFYKLIVLFGGGGGCPGMPKLPR